MIDRVGQRSSPRNSGAIRRGSGRRLWVLALIAIVVLSGSAQRTLCQEHATASDLDTLTLYIESLEDDLVDAGIVQDSLRTELRIISWEMDYLQDNQRKWYHDQRLWFLLGAVSSILVVGATLQITF